MFVSCVLRCVGSDDLITRSEECQRVCLCVSDVSDLGTLTIKAA